MQTQRSTWAGMLRVYHFGAMLLLNETIWFQGPFGRVAFLRHPEAGGVLDLDAQELAEHVTFHNAAAH